LIVASSANKEAALALASRGLRIFPCKSDKTPRVAAWEQTATNSPFAVAMKWEAAPDSLAALPVGPHGLVVIDADRKAGGADGVAAFHELCAERGIDLSTAFIVQTPSGGLHFYWRTDAPYGNSRGSLPDGIDVRGLGGYVIALEPRCRMDAAIGTSTAPGTQYRRSLRRWRPSYARNGL
jgi:hypothetical protein